MASLYLTGAIQKLPDYFARRITARYQETAMYLDVRVNFQPLHQTDSSTTTVGVTAYTEITKFPAHRYPSHETTRKPTSQRPPTRQLFSHGPSVEDS